MTDTDRQPIVDMAVGLNLGMGEQGAVEWVERMIDAGPLKEADAHRRAISRYAELGGNGLPHKGGISSSELFVKILAVLNEEV